VSRKDEAVRIFSQHFNCSQAIFAAYRDPDTLSESAALKLATAFGAGVACNGRGLCGAVSGALLAISAKHGRGSDDPVEAKSKTYELCRKFMGEFAARGGSCMCDELLGVNIGTPDGMERAQEARYFETKCPDYIKAAADILDEVL
jgi:C_GCAxxG_C_C family probable redox protein